MGRKVAELGALAVSRLTTPGLHFVGGVSGLALQILPTGGRTWVFRANVTKARDEARHKIDNLARDYAESTGMSVDEARASFDMEPEGGAYKITGAGLAAPIIVKAKRREMGLGGFPDVTLAAAREAAREALNKIKTGVDPIDERAAARSAMVAGRAKVVTFEEAASAYMSAHEHGWRNAKHAQQWRSSLKTYAYPVIGKLSLRDIELTHIVKIIEPIWRDKTETASRLRGRIEQVLDWGTVRGYREGTNPARWRGHLDKLLPAPTKVAKVEHHEALDWREICTFMKRLRAAEGMGARALEFAILTASRSGEVRGAKWDEIDLAHATWTIPPERMKAGREHRVALSTAAIALLKGLSDQAGNELVFPAPRGGTLSDMTLAAVLRRMDVNAVPHGFRSSFRDWAGESSKHPREVIEHALAHRLKDKAEAAYARGDMFAKRILLMEDWAKFCGKDQPAVIHAIGGRAAKG